MRSLLYACDDIYNENRESPGVYSTLWKVYIRNYHFQFLPDVMSFCFHSVAAIYAYTRTRANHSIKTKTLHTFRTLVHS